MIWTDARKDAALTEIVRWNGTPHADRKSEIGVGISCIHLVKQILVAADIIPDVEIQTYNERDGLHNSSEQLSRAIYERLHVESVSIDAAQFGDIAVFKNGQTSAHVAFVAPPVIWHSLARYGVTSGSLKIWKHKLATLYRVTATGLK